MTCVPVVSYVHIIHFCNFPQLAHSPGLNNNDSNYNNNIFILAPCVSSAAITATPDQDVNKLTIREWSLPLGSLHFLQGSSTPFYGSSLADAFLCFHEGREVKDLPLESPPLMCAG
ncbi:hypothetical protein E2C01_095273 [Portunus trituberculatus]|uniref:Uncharacterized protein n=1 Tax=Portunus trituberculatus TaxID=210409 RepID=A0A5B7JUU5_PORTR|nr:hypothetical protein [Portunus trituberculatus]